MRIELYFTSENEPSLNKVVVRRGGTAALVSVRGIFSFEPHTATFAWSAGLQALSILLVNACQLYLERAPTRSPGQAAHLSGGKRTPAETLDYALSREPAWLRELFGSSADGGSALTPLITVANRNGQRPVPIELRFRRPELIRVFRNGRALLELNELTELSRRLTASWRPHGARRSRPTIPEIGGKQTAEQERHTTFNRVFQAEAYRSLVSVDVFHTRKREERVRALLADASFQRVAGRHERLFADDLALASSERCGAGDIAWARGILERTPLQAAVAMSCIGTHCLLAHLAGAGDLPLSLDSRFSHAREIASRIIGGDPLITHDLVAMASAPAASLLANAKRHEYRPVMLLPSVGQRIVTPMQGRPARAGGGAMLGLLHEEPSVASFYYEALIDSGQLKRERHALLHQEPWEAAADLSSGEPELRSILFFPYAQLNVAFNNCAYADSEDAAGTVGDVILFAHRSVASDKLLLRAIAVSLLYSWRSLIDNAEVRSSTVSGILREQHFQENLARLSGLGQKLPLHCEGATLASPQFLT